MISRERVKRAIEHKPVDRVPLDLGMHFSTGISAFAYHNLRKALGLDTSHIEIPDPMEMLARVDEDILQMFHIDTMLLNPPYEESHRWRVRGDYEFIIPDTMDPQLQPDGSYVISKGTSSMRLPAGGYFFQGEWFDLKKDSFEVYYKKLGQRAKVLDDTTPYFTCAMGFSGFYLGIEQACNMYTDPESVHKRNEEVFAENRFFFDSLLEGGGKCVGCIEINSDLGMQNAPFISPEMYAEFCLPYLKRFIEYVKERSETKIFMHSCGSIEPLIPLIIEAGVEALNPVQISAANMDPFELKRKYGEKITFWGGGCDTQRVLAFKTPAEVKEYVKYLMSAFKPGGGFVFNQVHNIMGDVPPENIIAMLQTAYENSFYTEESDIRNGQG